MIESFFVNQLRIKIYQDEFSESPREFCNVGKMICFHGKYDLGDENPKCSPDEYIYEIMRDRESFVANKNLPDQIQVQDVEKYINKHFYFLPVYLYDHSGLSISTSPFSCPWDSGQIGFIYAPRESLESEDILKCLEEEVKLYNQFLAGDVYFYSIEDEDGNILDSCSGFYEFENCKSEAIESAKTISNTVLIGGNL
jgi:hypothetical protein